MRHLKGGHRHRFVPDTPVSIERGHQYVPRSRPQKSGRREDVED